MLTEQDIQHGVDFFNEHGYYVATNTSQDEVGQELVKRGLLKKVTPDLVREPVNGFYVHVSIDCKNKMPAVLHKIVFENNPFHVGEIVRVHLFTSTGMDVYVHGTFLRLYVTQNGKELAEMSIHNTVVAVPLEDVNRTFNEHD